MSPQGRKPRSVGARFSLDERRSADGETNDQRTQLGAELEEALGDDSQVADAPPCADAEDDAAIHERLETTRIEFGDELTAVIASEFDREGYEVGFEPL